MPIASLIVEIRAGAHEPVLGRLARMNEISVYGVKENQIVTVVETATAAAVERILKEIQEIEDVTGVYPVFVREDE